MGGVQGQRGRAGEAIREVFTQWRKERGHRKEKKNTITDEKMRFEEGKMLLLEAFF